MYWGLIPPLCSSPRRALAQDIPNLAFEEGDGRSLSLNSDAFDVVIVHLALSHVPQPEQLVAQAFRVLRPEGWLAVFDGDYATATVAAGEFDLLETCVHTFRMHFVHDSWIVRRLPQLLRTGEYGESMSQYGWNNSPPGAKTQTQQFTRTVAQLLADNIVGIYLHGSLAMGCFNPEHSDLDLLVITHQRMQVGTKRQLAEFLLTTSRAPHPIELSVVVHTDLVPWQYPTPFDFHYSEMWRERIQQDLHHGRWPHWNAQLLNDPDLAAHVTITNHRGLCLHGAPIAHVFPDVPKADYLASILGDVKDALASIMDAPVYAILNTCRVYAFVRDGSICSKQEGGEWALTVVPEDVRPVIELALEIYAAGQQHKVFDTVAITRFVAYMHEQLPA
jgi:predicted nucleotidyltransferase